MNKSTEIHFILNKQSKPQFQEHFHVFVSCDGRQYDPHTESYHPVYSYIIRNETNGREWEYIGNDITGGANEVPNTVAGMQSLLAFLIACQEGLPEDTEATHENAQLFPAHVREFAYMCKELIEIKYQEIYQKTGRE